MRSLSLNLGCDAQCSTYISSIDFVPLIEAIQNAYPTFTSHAVREIYASNNCVGLYIACETDKSNTASVPDPPFSRGAGYARLGAPVSVSV